MIWWEYDEGGGAATDAAVDLAAGDVLMVRFLIIDGRVWGRATVQPGCSDAESGVVNGPRAEPMRPLHGSASSGATTGCEAGQSSHTERI